MVKQPVRSPHAKCATAILRLANTGIADETPMRRIIECYNNGRSVDPFDLDLLRDVCDVLGFPLDDMLRLDDVRDGFDPDTYAKATIGMMPLEHWH